MRYGALLLFVLLAGLVAMSFYQPPMRLMPAPAIFVDGRSSVFEPGQAETSEPEISVFYATNRLPLSFPDDRLYAIVPDRNLHLGEALIHIGEEGTTWDKIYSWSTGASDDRRPFLHLARLTETATIEPSQPLTAEATAWFASIENARKEGLDSDVIVYVHGANTTMERASGQAAQLQHFTGRNSVVILFAWPTAENFFRYSRDMVTAFGAAPQLVELVKLLSEHTNASKIDVFTYSAGGTVGSSALSLIGQLENEALPKPLRLGEIYHAAPDADFRTFVSEMRDYSGLARRITVSLNLNDSALRLSQVINRASRAGRPDMRELDAEETNWLLEGSREAGFEVLRVRPENIPGLSRRSHTFWYDDPWVSSDVLITLLYHLGPQQRGLKEDVAPSGIPYWTFTSDYPEQLQNVLDQLREDGKFLTEMPD